MKPNFSEEIEKLWKILNYLKKCNPSDDRSEKDILFKTLSLTRLTFSCNCGKRKPIFIKVSKKSAFEMWKTFNTGEKKTLKIIILSILTT